MNSRLAVLEIMVPGVEITDSELVAGIPHLHRGKVIPARYALAKKGVVELVGKNEQGVNVWRRTAPDRVEAAKEEAAARRLTHEARIGAEKPERQAQVIAALLEDATVNRILRGQNERSAAMRRARARAGEAQAESEAQRRERKRELKQAEKEQAANLEFLKVRDSLRDSVSALIGIQSFLKDELERLEDGVETRIAAERWGAALKNVVEVLLLAGSVWHDASVTSGHHPEHCPLCGSRTARDPQALDEGYLEGEVVEVVELVE